MAHFRMHTQIKQQTIAFAKGFHCIFSSDSLSLFSVPEVIQLCTDKLKSVYFSYTIFFSIAAIIDIWRR